MERLQFSITLNATPKKVWQALWDLDNYRKWTKVFAEGSNVETDNWKEGSKVLFTDGSGSGMVSMVAANRPEEFMSFRHLGELKDGIEDTTSDKVKAWSGAMEDYTLKEQNGKTVLTVEMDMAEDFKEYFMKTWPEALEQIKTLSES